MRHWLLTCTRPMVGSTWPVWRRTRSCGSPRARSRNARSWRRRWTLSTWRRRCDVWASYGDNCSVARRAGTTARGHSALVDGRAAGGAARAGRRAAPSPRPLLARGGCRLLAAARVVPRPQPSCRAPWSSHGTAARAPRYASRGRPRQVRPAGGCALGLGSRGARRAVHAPLAWPLAMKARAWAPGPRRRTVGRGWPGAGPPAADAGRRRRRTASGGPRRPRRRTARWRGTGGPAARRRDRRAAPLPAAGRRPRRGVHANECPERRDGLPELVYPG